MLWKRLSDFLHIVWNMGHDEHNDAELIADFTEHTRLSEREAEVAVLLGNAVEEAESDKVARQAVADEMDIQPSTVDTYYRRALLKLKESFETAELASGELPEVAERAKGDNS